jgi:hypothetical protein
VDGAHRRDGLDDLAAPDAGFFELDDDRADLMNRSEDLVVQLLRRDTGMRVEVDEPLDGAAKTRKKAGGNGGREARR